MELETAIAQKINECTEMLADLVKDAPQYSELKEDQKKVYATMISNRIEMYRQDAQRLENMKRYYLQLPLSEGNNETI